MPRLRAFSAVSTTCLQKVGLHGALDHRQKLYLGTITAFLFWAYNQLISDLRQFINEMCSTDFIDGSLIVDSNGVFKESLIELKGKVEVHISSIKQILLSFE